MTTDEKVIASIMARATAASGTAVFVDAILLRQLLTPLLDDLAAARAEGIRVAQEAAQTISGVMAERDAARAEAARLREPESDEAWMRRVYPQHAWTPDDGITYEQFCRLSRGKWEAEHKGLEADLAAARAEAARLREFYNAWQRCESCRGCYSCTEAHDCRCPKDRGLGECACGRDRLMAAEAALEGKAALDTSLHNTDR